METEEFDGYLWDISSLPVMTDSCSISYPASTTVNGTLIEGVAVYSTFEEGDWDTLHFSHIEYDEDELIDDEMEDEDEEWEELWDFNHKDEEEKKGGEDEKV
jgi:hypothetical protein